MSERLENFIRNNRKQFDEFEAPADLWAKIDSDLDAQAKSKPLKKERVVKLGFVLKIAATFILVCGAALMYWGYKKSTTIDISEINPQLARQQFHYASLIHEKRKELKQIKKQDPQLYQEFSSEIKKMDENYKKLKKDLITSPNQEETVKAMIRNLQIQIQVLNQQLQIIDQVHEFKKSNINENQGI
jgi:septal ring factor EnvC (AmiA/AmiB activator)